MHTCKNCGHSFTGKFCNQCGEKVYSDHDRSVPHLAEEAFHFFTHFDGTFFNTLKALTRPGKLSAEYCSGVRRKYFKPLSFFLLLVILYLIFPRFEGLNMHLKYHETHSLYGAYATHEKEATMGKRHLSEEQVSEAFHHKGEKVSKFLLFITLPFTALVSMGLGYRKRKYYFDHFIFSTEAGSFFILWGFLLFPLLLMLLALVGIRPHFSGEWMIGLIVVTVSTAYVIRAARRFFGFPIAYSFLYGVLFCASLVLFLEFVYKFLLFVIAINIV